MRLAFFSAFVLVLIGLVPATARADNVTLINTHSCNDVNGRVVVTQWLPGHENVNVVNGIPVIQLDPGLMDSIPPIVADFLYFHECGHHALGHVQAIVQNGAVFAMAFAFPIESAADCYGLDAVKARGAGPADLQLLFAQLARFTVPTGGHPLGPIRVQNMQTCP